MKRCIKCNLVCNDKEDVCPKCGCKLEEIEVDEWTSTLDFYD